MSGCDPGTLIPLFWIDIYWYSLLYQFSKLSRKHLTKWWSLSSSFWPQINISSISVSICGIPHTLVTVFLIYTHFVSICFQVLDGVTFTSAPVSSLPFTFCYWFHYYKYFSCFFLFNCCNLFSTKSSNDADTSLTF